MACNQILKIEDQLLEWSLHVNLKYNEWKISGSQSIAIATNDSVCDRCASVDRSI